MTAALAVPAFLGDAEKLLGADRVSDSAAVLAGYARDAYPLAVRGNAGHPGLVAAPAAVVWPETTREVAALVAAATRYRVPLVPYGGGSGIAGGALAVRGGVVVDLKRMNRILDIDAESLTATVQAGILGGEIEAKLAAHGFTCGHYPQSLWSSTVGGWVAHRGVGTFSTKYGKMDDLVVALEVVLPDGQVLRTRNVPASAAGPDLNRLFLGAEGTLGIVTAATLKIFPQAPHRAHASYAFPGFAAGIEAVRHVVQRGLRPAVVRMYDAEETRAQFGSLGLAAGQSVLLVLDEGEHELTEHTMRAVERQATAAGGRPLGGVVGDHWLAHRFSTAALCRTLAAERGVADALEVANRYSRLVATYDAMKSAMEDAGAPDVHVYGHGSHFYHTGGNLYMIFHATAAGPGEVTATYHRIVAAALRACLREGGTLTHHHGVGIGKAAHMTIEWGPAGTWLWRTLREGLDPYDLMNPGGKVIPE